MKFILNLNLIISDKVTLVFLYDVRYWLLPVAP